MQLSLDVPVVALGASARTHYPAVGRRLGARVKIPDHAEVANAVGAVVGRVAMSVEGTVTSPTPGRFVAHLPGGPQGFAEADAAISALARALEAEVEGQRIFVEARLRVTAQGRARLARR